MLAWQSSSVLYAVLCNHFPKKVGDTECRCYKNQYRHLYHLPYYCKRRDIRSYQCNSQAGEQGACHDHQHNVQTVSKGFFLFNIMFQLHEHLVCNGRLLRQKRIVRQLPE